MNINLVINSKPIAKGRPRMTRNGYAYTPKKTREYEELIKWEFEKLKVDKLKGPLLLKIEFHFKMAKSWTKKKKKTKLGKSHTQKPDLDNLIKIIDALNGLAFDDDSQIADISAKKYWSDENITKIYIEEIE